MSSHRSRRSLLILGTGPFAIEIGDVAGDVADLEVVGYVENQDRDRCSQPLAGLPVHWVDDLAGLSRSHWVVCGLGTTHRSRFTAQAESAGCRFATVVHPTARISRTSELGIGSILHPGALLGSHSRLGAHVCVNRGATIGHHTVIDDFVTVSPGVDVAGSCRIACAVYLGIGAKVIDHITIGAHSVVGAGAVVIKDVPERSLVVGVPARVVRQGIEGK